MSESLIKQFTLTHLATKAEIKIPLLISLYEQDTKPNFSSTSVYGRMDPIFTYQNTVRTFSVTCQTITPDKYKDFYVSASNPVEQLEAVADDEDIRQSYGGFISDLYKMMYPLYERETRGSGVKKLTTNTLKSPPILQLKIDDIIGQSKAVIFVPENFSLVSGFANRSEINITIDSGDDIRYVALAGGYGFTLGGTILHEENPPGFTVTNGGGGGGATYKFSPDNSFPLGAGTTMDILKG